MKLLSSPLFVPVAVVAGVLVVATLAWALLTRLKPGSDFRELGLRIRSWWVMATVVLGAVLLVPSAALAFWALVCFWALREFFSLVPGRWEDRTALFLAYLAVPIQFLWVFLGWYGMFIVFVPVYMFLAVAVALIVVGQPKGFVASASRIHWGLMSFVFGLSHAAFLLQLPEKPGFEAGPRGLFLYLVLLVQLNDVFQYVTGKLFGRHKIAPVVSPNKTWEGFLGGLLLTAPLGVLLRFLTPLSLPEAVGAGILLPVFGFFGDLAVGSVKRDVGVKDAGSSIPGHGGVLDRVNSLCYAAPLFFHYVRYLAY
ncbi:MAG: phosphatidate cytidylyltransferase [Holophagales bacterium]|nr:phosphatidate cytidylyltransferase [Holophagales bacterium]